MKGDSHLAGYLHDGGDMGGSCGCSRNCGVRGFMDQDYEFTGHGRHGCVVER